MSIAIRPATAADALFVAWVMQEAARSHVPRGFWDLAFPGEEAERLEILAKIATSERIHLSHVSRFRVLEVDGVPAAALSAYENSEHGLEKLTPVFLETLVDLGWSEQAIQDMAERIASFEGLAYPNPDGLWVVEWVATRPEFRGRSLCNRLLLEILEEGRDAGFECAQIGFLLGNVAARSAYERVGFKWVDEYRSAAFEADYGSPGVARMQRDL